MFDKKPKKRRKEVSKELTAIQTLNRCLDIKISHDYARQWCKANGIVMRYNGLEREKKENMKREEKRNVYPWKDYEIFEYIVAI